MLNRELISAAILHWIKWHCITGIGSILRYHVDSTHCIRDKYLGLVFESGAEPGWYDNPAASEALIKGIGMRTGILKQLRSCQWLSAFCWCRVTDKDELWCYWNTEHFAAAGVFRTVDCQWASGLIVLEMEQHGTFFFTKSANWFKPMMHIAAQYLVG